MTLGPRIRVDAVLDAGSAKDVDGSGPGGHRLDRIDLGYAPTSLTGCILSVPGDRLPSRSVLVPAAGPHSGAFA